MYTYESQCVWKMRFCDFVLLYNVDTLFKTLYFFKLTEKCQ